MLRGAVPCCAVLYLILRACSIIISGPSLAQLGSSAWLVSSAQLSSAAQQSASSAERSAMRRCAVLLCRAALLYLHVHFFLP